MSLSFCIFGVFLNACIILVESGAEHQACPVGFPGTVKHALSRKIKTTDFLCEKDSDCPNGKCCGILGGNMCIYLHDKKTNEPRSMDLRSKLSKILNLSEWENSQTNKSEDWHKGRMEKALRSGTSYKCFDKIGRKIRSCSNGFRWRHILFLFCSGGLCVVVGLAGLMIYQKKKGNTKSNPNKKLRKQNMATAVHDQNPVYVMRVGKGMKVFLNMEDLAGKQANPRNRPSDVTNVQLHDQERERTASI
ncbi:uncharacterized protein LOC128167031 [Crassostrea angulata]|uniref:uncharacterized protein LOC128167031 n=1 Tax=Magallana angulata TaxID=2784310 RepID=UPI0022B15A47|nr:uncharacterized protein LOC128167031 [Crassostrea angulata]